jgi:hypothetical protein
MEWRQGPTASRLVIVLIPVAIPQRKRLNKGFLVYACQYWEIERPCAGVSLPLCTRLTNELCLDPGTERSQTTIPSPPACMRDRALRINITRCRNGPVHVRSAGRYQFCARVRPRPGLGATAITAHGRRTPARTRFAQEGSLSSCPSPGGPRYSQSGHPSAKGHPVPTVANASAVR